MHTTHSALAADAPATDAAGTALGAEPPRPRGGPASGPAAGARQAATPPITLEGWYAHHQLFTIDRAAARRLPAAERAEAARGLADALAALAAPAEGGWSAPVLLVGSTADVMVLHFRPTIDALGDAQRRVLAEPGADLLRPAYSFLSVTEAGMYALVARLAAEARARGGAVGDPAYEAALAERLEAERASGHVQKRLYPPAPTAEMPYVCFYPMSKRRAPEQNWYELPIEERSRLMWEHGMSGRRHAGKIFQIVTGAIGLDDWEWGVTLFGGDPLSFKRAVTEMRFDEASARYAEFGRFFVGRVAAPEEWARAVLGG